MKIIEHSSKKGDVVLDPFAGSGSTCKACEGLGRRWIGIELDGKWTSNLSK
jgi:adenine-specific DNA-methyltransferase